MPIQNNIPRKLGHNPTATPETSPFPGPPSGHTTVNAFPGLNYNCTFTDAQNAPLATNLNIATQPQYPALKGVTGHVAPLHQFVRVQPNNRTQSYSMHVFPKKPPIKQSGGVSSNTDTPFHAIKKKPLNIPIPHPSITTEKRSTGISVASGEQKNNFTIAGRATNKTVGSFLPNAAGGKTIASNPYNDQLKTRWSITSRGAGEGTLE